MHAVESTQRTAPGKAPRIAILASGRGSNAEALMDAFSSGFIPAELACVLCNMEGAAVLEKAERRGIPVRCIPHRGISRATHEAHMLDALHEFDVEHVLLAGYMRIVSLAFIERVPGVILNIHPSLLPDFPGLEAQKQAWNAGMKVVGATVHHVDGTLDGGPIVLQGAIVVRGDEGPGGLAKRILHEVEHDLYPRAVRLVLDRLRLGLLDHQKKGPVDP